MRLYNQSSIARELGVNRSAVANYLVRHPDEVPDPVAYLQDAGGRQPVPLWSEDQLPAWRTVAAIRRGTPAVQRAVADVLTEAEKRGLSLAELIAMLPTSSPQGDKDDRAEPSR